MRGLSQSSQRPTKMVLVGNKCDLKKERQVDTAQGKALADELGVDFFETSARTGEGVELCFMHLARQVVEARDKPATKEQDQRPKHLPPNPPQPCGCLI